MQYSCATSPWSKKTHKNQKRLIKMQASRTEHTFNNRRMVNLWQLEMYVLTLHFTYTTPEAIAINVDVLSHYIATCKIPTLVYLQLEPNPGVFYTLISAGSIIDESEGEYIYRMFLRHKLPMFRHE